MSLMETLAQCAARIEQYSKNGTKIGETNTKSTIIEPILSALGWDMLDLDETHREFRYRQGSNPVDYALKLARAPKLFVEAKGYGENLNDMRWSDQTISYAATAGVNWVALTDGVTWKLFNANAPGTTEQKLFRTVTFADGIAAVADVLTLLSKDSMRNDCLPEMWRNMFVDKQINEFLTGLFNSDEVSRSATCINGVIMLTS